MAGFRNISEFAEAVNAGRTHSCSIRKVPSQASTAGWWVDLSMAAGNPQPNYYASDPLVAAELNGDRGIFHGADKSPESMFLTEMSIVTPTAGLVGQYKLLDYLIYYPFIDLDSTDEQAFDNTVTLPRYTDGEGVRAIMVSVAPTTGSGQFTMNYTNQDGASKTSPVQFCSVAAANIASIITSEQATAAGGQLFLRLADGDTGIRSIESVTMLVPNGGLAALVLVKPLADHVIREVSVPNEASFITQHPGCPQIVDGAYLGLVMNCAATVAAGTLAGRMTFAWK